MQQTLRGANHPSDQTTYVSTLELNKMQSGQGSVGQTLQGQPTFRRQDGVASTRSPTHGKEDVTYNLALTRRNANGWIYSKVW